MRLNKTPLGYEVRTPRVTILLGGQLSQLPRLLEVYDNFKFTRLKQTHSDLVVQVYDSEKDYQIQGDSHFTKTSKLALCISTADCVPVFIYDPSSPLIAAIHAGWRGVASQIISKTIKELIQQGAKPRDLNIVIGPHIQRQSFEVDVNVRDQILSSLEGRASEDLISFYEERPHGKALVDLNLVVCKQLQQCGVNLEKVFNLHIDTMTNLEFHSYRRDKELSGRQISFIGIQPD